MAISVTFAAIVSLHWATPTILLATTFLLGVGGALAAPAWLLITPMLVPRARSRQRDRHQQHELQREPRDRSGARRVRDRGDQHRCPVLVLLRGESGAPGRDRLVARSAPNPRDSARRAPFERAANRASLRPLQSRHQLDAHPRRRLFPFCERVLGASSARRQNADAQWSGDLRHSPRDDRGRLHRRILRAQLAERAAGPRSPRGARNRRHDRGARRCTAPLASLFSRRRRASSPARPGSS